MKKYLLFSVLLSTAVIATGNQKNPMVPLQAEAIIKNREAAIDNNEIALSDSLELENQILQDQLDQMEKDFAFLSQQVQEQYAEDQKKATEAEEGPKRDELASESLEKRNLGLSSLDDHLQEQKKIQEKISINLDQMLSILESLGDEKPVENTENLFIEPEGLSLEDEQIEAASFENAAQDAEERAAILEDAAALEEAEIFSEELSNSINPVSEDPSPEDAI
jgi:hypothetical protein